MNAADIEKLLGEPDDFELCDRIFCRLADFDNRVDAASYGDEERVITPG